ncbi:hypothetical protein [Cellulomonas sp. RIT-PI-Y]|uniref:hypothetical protein n=1 Tax=Cellulomonas sp. RIT-PI-Y TaxID=3035297 RepID=UPI0021DB5BCA|nr:hypothetical protein [Cellulomonas sp. RIT-PI-Y]
MPEIADWLFAPVAWTTKLIDGGFAADLGGVAGLFIWASTIVFAVSVIVAFTIYTVLLNLDPLMERIAIWSIRGGNVVTMQRAASRYVTTRSILARLRRRTGVASGSEPDPPESLRPWLTGRQPIGGRLVRALLGVPAAMTQASRFIMHWLRTPVGLYLALGSIWVALRPTTAVSAAGDQLVKFWHSISEPAGVAVVAVLLTAAAVALDHGLKSRTRGRNAFLQSQAATAAAALEQISAIAVDLRDSVHALVDNHVALYSKIVTSAVEHATEYRWTVRNGEVTKKHSVTRPWHLPINRPNWRHDRPLSELVYSYPPLEALQRNEEHLLADIVRIRDAVGDWDRYWAIRRQAPSAARGPLWELCPAGGRAIAQGTRPVATHKIVALLDTARLERFGRDLVRQVETITRTPSIGCLSTSDLDPDTDEDDEDVDDPPTAELGVEPGALEQIQQVLDDKAEEFLHNLWRASCFAAEMDRLIRAVDRDHNARGFAARLGY